MTAGDRARVRRIADGIVAAHASYRRRVRWAMVAGATVLLVAALPSLLVLNRPGGGTAAASGGGGGSAASPAMTSGTAPPTGARSDGPAVIRSDGEGSATDYAAALRRWRPHGVIRVYRGSTTPTTRARLRAELGPGVRFVGTAKRAAVLHASGAISFPRAASAHGSSS